MILLARISRFQAYSIIPLILRKTLLSLLLDLARTDLHFRDELRYRYAVTSRSVTRYNMRAKREVLVAERFEAWERERDRDRADKLGREVDEMQGEEARADGEAVRDMIRRLKYVLLFRSSYHNAVAQSS
jgi:hypothetical protein